MLGEKILKARKAKKLTQTQLADMLNVRHNSISNWENNINKPDADMISKLCEALGVEPNYLIANDSNVSNTNIKKFVNDKDAEELTPEAKVELDNFIQYLKVKYKKP